MPMDFLARIQHEQFPLTIADPDQINSAAVLRAAGMIEADVPAAQPTDSQPMQKPAVIVAITALGQHELQKYLSAAAAQARLRE